MLALIVGLQAALEQSAAFAQLAREHGVLSNVRLGEPEGGGERGLFCTRDISAGEPLLVVPWSLCLVDAEQPEDDPLTSPWESAEGSDRPARDVRLAAQLLDQLCDTPPSCSGMRAASADAARGELSAFWRQWCTLLPRITTCSQPMTLTQPLLSQLQHGALAQAGRRQRQRLLKLLATAPAANDDERAWAVAMCSSRPFRMPTPETARRDMQQAANADANADADADASADASAEASAEAADATPRRMLSAFVPFIDMANHEEEPNCEVQGVGGTTGTAGSADEGGVAGGSGVGMGVDGGGQVGGYQVVGLVASRDLTEGEEAFISYGSCTSNAALFASFGFAPPHPVRSGEALPIFPICHTPVSPIHHPPRHLCAQTVSSRCHHRSLLSLALRSRRRSQVPPRRRWAPSARCSRPSCSPYR